MYDDEPFVHLLPAGQQPERSPRTPPARTPVCSVSPWMSGRRAVITSALDNLGKGTAGRRSSPRTSHSGLPRRWAFRWTESRHERYGGRTGFEAAAVAAGLKSSGGLDLALVVNLGPSSAAAAVFTSNRSKANPIIWSQQVIADGVASGDRPQLGRRQLLHRTAGVPDDPRRRRGGRRGGGSVGAGDVLVCSTGLIGEQLDRDALLSGWRRGNGPRRPRRRRLARHHDHRQPAEALGARGRGFGATRSAAWGKVRACSRPVLRRCSS